MSDTTGPCICKKTVVNRCSACKLVSYCSKECQRLDRKNHKIQCKAATATGSSKLKSDRPARSTNFSASAPSTPSTKKARLRALILI
ncbi:hypothetical protein B0H14DRAFT_151099 [Mycena olivaceomarginata]|nr:hypothetical protein B0H14DRAFT_151099 [Mycena olivaceomarginata]